MINFDEEIQKFHPALEISDVEDAIKTENAIQDLTDLMMSVLKTKPESTPAGDSAVTE